MLRGPSPHLRAITIAGPRASSAKPAGPHPVARSPEPATQSACQRPVPTASRGARTHTPGRLVSTGSPASLDDWQQDLRDELPHDEVVERTPSADALARGRQPQATGPPSPAHRVLYEFDLARGETVARVERRGVERVLRERDRREVRRDERLRLRDRELEPGEEGEDEALSIVESVREQSHEGNAVGVPRSAGCSSRRSTIPRR